MGVGMEGEVGEGRRYGRRGKEGRKWLDSLN